MENAYGGQFRMTDQPLLKDPIFLSTANEINPATNYTSKPSGALEISH
jgi:hypothetical protein